jgi:dihydroorotase/N-acyl-D-amino-acid deacylase
MTVTPDWSSVWDNEWQEIPGPDAIMIGVLQNPQLLQFQAKRLTDFARTWNKDPIDTLFDFLIEDNAFRGCAVFGMSEADVSLALQQQWVAVNSNSSGTTHALHRSRYARRKHVGGCRDP